jgi:predicted PolB exonuclease-like 3'-5' exonuclease
MTGFYNKISSPEHIMVVDIETIPDVSLAHELCEIDSEASFSEQELRETMSSYHIEKHNGNPFLRQPFWNIVCLSYVLVKIIKNGDGTEFHEIVDVNSISSFKSSEKALLEKFWSLFNKYKPKLVTWNGANFDVPVLKYRSMKYGISCSFFFQHGGKWDGYQSKYSAINIDLMLLLSDYGSSAKLKLSEICCMLAIPCKLGDNEGSKVSEFYDAQKYTEIREYCETDVLATYLVFARYCILSGVLGVADYNNITEQIENLIIGSEKKGLKEFLQEWYRLSNNKIKLEKCDD